MRNTIGLLVLMTLTANVVYAQNTGNNALTFPSVNNAFLDKEQLPTNVGVDYYTGTAKVSVPICNLQSKTLNIPVSLNYVDGRGVRVQEYASQVGLGWQLNAGGSISRVVRGFPDEQPNGYLGTGQWGKVVYTGSTSPTFQTFLSTISLANAETLTGLEQTNGEPLADGEPDIFFVKTPYFGFQFVFDQNGNAIVSNNTGIKIISSNFVNTSNYQNSSFQVIDDQGNQYYFGNTANSTETETDSIFGQVPPAFITSWYLTKIVSYNAADSVLFTYTDGVGAGENTDVNYNYSWMETQNFISSPTPVNTLTMSTGKTTISLPKYVSTITSTLGELEFGYTYPPRLDDPGAPCLYSVSLLAYTDVLPSWESLLQTYYFNYSYFNSPSTNPNLLRLELKNIQVTGGAIGLTTLASFGYNTTNNLSDRTLPFFDYWGYCMPTPSPRPSDIVGMLRPPNLATTEADVLDSVTTISGDTWQFSYELNTYAQNGVGSANVGGLRVNKLSHTLPTGENVYTTYQYADASGNSWGQIYSTNYNSLEVTTATGTNGGFQVTFSSSPYTVSDLNGDFVGYSSVREVSQNGGYTLYNFTNFSDFSDPIQSSGSSTSILLTPNTSLAYKRGLLKSESVYTASGNLVSQTTNTYSSLNSPVTNGAYGFRVVVLPNFFGPWSTYGYYSTPVENYRLTRSVKQDFDQVTPANSVTLTTNYTYDPQNNRLVKMMTSTDSKNQTRYMTVYRSEDVAAGIPLTTSAEATAIDSMLAHNRTNIVVHTSDSLNGTVKRVHNSYLVGAANKVNLVTASTYLSDPVNATNTLAQQQSYVYDPAYSNLISTSLLGGKSTAIQYGYDQALPVVKVVNATSSGTLATSTPPTDNFTNEFFYEGFEVDGNFFTSAHTGSISDTGYRVPFVLPNGRSYLIQWWNWSSGANAWVFNQQAYTGPVTLSGQVDDIRVFPKDALMTTYTYNPQVGKTSEIDPSGKALVYQYDGLNRLQTVRDLDNNIVKQYDYEYGACAVQVYNTVQTASFIRNNCAAGLYGSEVTYSVAAGKYSGCTQAAANQLATNDVNYYGQIQANTTGTCSATAPCVAATNVQVIGGAGAITISWNYPPGVPTNAYGVNIVNVATGATVFSDYGASSPLTATSNIAYNTTYSVTITSLCSGSPITPAVTTTTSGAVSQAVNLTSAATAPSGFCCHGCQYTGSVYSSTATIGPGSLLYTNAALTTPLTGTTYIFPYNNNTSNVIYQLSGNTVLSTTVACQ